MQTTIIGNVENGEFVPNSKEYFKKAFESYEGKIIELSLKVWHKKRTTPQNSYYWGVVIELIKNFINDLGNDFDSDTIHELLRSLFLKTTKELINKESGEVTTIEYIKSTTKLSTIEFENYIENCKRYAAQQFDIYIPDADRN
jgi:ribosomal protein S17E